jgi:hypothetical protein
VKQVRSRRCVLLILGHRCNSVPRLVRGARPSPISGVCRGRRGIFVCQCEHKLLLGPGGRTEDNKATRRFLQETSFRFCPALLCRNVPSAVNPIMGVYLTNMTPQVFTGMAETDYDKILS